MFIFLVIIIFYQFIEIKGKRKECGELYAVYIVINFGARYYGYSKYNRNCNIHFRDAY